MREYISTGTTGRFQGFLACVIGAAFVIAGPEYISMVRGILQGFYLILANKISDH